MVILVALYMKSICSSMDQLSKSNKNIAICLGATHPLRLNRGSTFNVCLDSRVGAVYSRSSKPVPLIGLVGVKSHNDFVLYLC